jgi:hypothetical protein
VADLALGVHKTGKEIVSVCLNIKY